MSTPQDPDRPEDRPAEQSGYPAAPPPDPAQRPHDPGPTGQQSYPPPPPSYGDQPPAGQQSYPPPPSYGDQPPAGQQPYAGGPAPSYGNAPAYNPYAAPGFGTAPTRAAVPPPKEVVWATWAMYAAIAFSLISLLVRLIDSDSYKDAIRNANRGRTDVNIDQVYTAAVVFAVVLTLVISAVYVLLAINLRKGKNWARITTWIVVVVLTVLGLLSLGGNVPAFAHLFDVLVVLANIAALVLLALRPSNQFFTAMKQPQYPQY